MVQRLGAECLIRVKHNTWKIVVVDSIRIMLRL